MDCSQTLNTTFYRYDLNRLFYDGINKIQTAFLFSRLRRPEFYDVRERIEHRFGRNISSLFLRTLLWIYDPESGRFCNDNSERPDGILTFLMQIPMKLGRNLRPSRPTMMG
ncbi:hypothetical protein CEXT_408131 [Caerostris extrusa]|uniref:Uncharacterized protein n=1 Tax=Caerostris extrusa TaxID=172846 RepID=A0AAV4NEW5_CAEEX|nr:hypothetical protein CEXT_408131 [Caerostris extrusa]